MKTAKIINDIFDIIKLGLVTWATEDATEETTFHVTRGITTLVTLADTIKHLMFETSSKVGKDERHYMLQSALETLHDFMTSDPTLIQGIGVMIDDLPSVEEAVNRLDE